MRKLYRLTMTLALLITAVSGAWAQTAFGVKEITADMLPASWSTDESAVTADDLAKLGFMEVTKDAAKTWTGAPQQGTVRLVYTLCESVNWVNGVGGGEATYSSRKIFYSCLDGQRIFITTELTEWSLTPDETDKKVWTLAKMPASNVELQVEYYAESYLFLGKEAMADKANITVKNGETTVAFDDNGKSTNTVTEGNTVTATYTGKKVLGMTVAKKAPKPDFLAGVFSVSSTKKVKFSRGNLRYASSKWSFFDNQYDYYNSYSADAWDHFGWSTSANTYGMNTSTDDNNYSGDFVDWGATMGTGWFTLTKDEWTYLFNTRSASTVNGTENGRYAKAEVNNVMGIILFPDTYTHPDGVTAPTGVNATDNTGWNGNSYTAADWTKMEAAGCVFLPATGARDGSTMNMTGWYGYYWSATPSGAGYAYYVSLTSSSLQLYSYGRYNGYSVRLVREVTE